MLDFLLTNPICRGKYKKVLLYNDDPITEAEKKQYYEQQGVEFLVGKGSFAGLEQAGVIILSPGINGKSSRFDEFRQKGVEILSEIEFASHFFKAKVVSVTGTNGKSTTVSLIHHILSENGVKSFLAGNIGTPLIAEVDRITADSIVVLELSSFQLEEIIQFKSHIALLLNVTPDHLDRYSSLADYFSAKKNIFKNQSENDYMVLNYDDSLLREQAGGFGPGKRTWFSLAHKDIPAGAFIERDHIVLRFEGSESCISLKNNPLRGLHNLENLLAAAISARLCGVGSAGIEAAIPSFKGLPHRMEAAGKIGNVEFINDSKATNVDAALKSINSIDPPMVLILGGKDKGGDFKQLEQAIRQKADAVLLLGKAAKTIAGQLPGLEEKFIFVKDLAEAAAVGYEYLANSGGVVLLAPACASFDMFDNFEHRGEVFKKEVFALKEAKEKTAHG